MARRKDPIFEALPGDKKVREEYKRLLNLFQNADPKRLELAKKEIARAAFLAVTLDELERDIDENGYKEEYQNGENQRGVKESAAAKLHVSYTKNFLSAMKQLHDYLTPGTNESAGDDFDSF